MKNNFTFVQINEKYRLQRLKVEDQDRLFQLMKKIYPPAYSHFWSDQGKWYLDLCYNTVNLKKELSRARSHYFFVENQSEVIGILKYDYPFSPRVVNIPNAMKLHRLYLHPKIHGSGIASQIMMFLEELAIAEGLDSIWLEAMEKQPQAKRFYEKMGYKLVHTYKLDFEKFLPGFEKIQILQKKLTQSK